MTVNKNYVYWDQRKFDLWMNIKLLKKIVFNRSDLSDTDLTFGHTFYYKVLCPRKFFQSLITVFKLPSLFKVQIRMNRSIF